MMLNTQTKLNLKDEVREFVGDFNIFFDDLKKWTEDAVQIKTWREFFEEKYPKMFSDSSGTEMDVDVDTTMETASRPIADREEKLHKVEEKLLSNKTNESFTDYDHVMSDDKLSLPQKVIHLQKGVEDSTRRKIYYASLQGQLLEKCFCQLKKVYKETLVETKITREWALFLRKLHKLVLNYSELQFCTVSLRSFCSNFKIIKEICECDKEGWK